MIHQSPGLTEKHKTTHTPIGYFLASVSDSQKYRQEKRSHWARGLRWIFRGQRALSISVIYRMQENDSRCARGTKNTTIWKHDEEGMQPCVVSFPASSVQSSNMCVSTAVSSSTISCIIIRQIQLQRFFFLSPSEGQVMKKVVLVHSSQSSLTQSQRFFGKCQNIYCGQFEDL